MPTIRRLYLYLVSAVSLGMLAVSVVSLLQNLLNFVVGTTTSAEITRENIAIAIGAATVALPVWAIHWTIANRLSSRDASERSAALRRLYLYGVLAVSAVGVAVAASDIASRLANVMVADTSLVVSSLLDPLPPLGLAVVIWWYHWSVTRRDWNAVGEVGASATIRRWYLYGSAFWAQLVLLAATTTLVRFCLELLTGLPTAGGHVVAVDAVGPTLAGLLVWAGHWAWSTRGPSAAEDRSSVLRTVYLLGAIGVAVTVTLVQAGQVLFYLLSRLLGVTNPGGLAGTIVQLLTGPVAAAVVYGASWAFHVQVLRREAPVTDESPRRLGVRRFYRYLVALVALSLLAVGLGGVLWTVGDLLTSATFRSETAWREQISLFATLAIVGLPVWLAVWRPVVAPSEAGALTRRLYLYLGLVAAVLAALFAGATLLYQLVAVALSVRLPAEALVDGTRAAAVLVVSAGVGGYQWRSLRLDSQRATVAPRRVTAAARLRLVGPDGRTVRELTGDAATLTALFDRLAAEVDATAVAAPAPSSPTSEAAQ